MFASAATSTPSNHGERWLTSSTEAPMPGSASRSRWISSSTASGSAPGPGEKLNTRRVICDSEHGRVQAPPAQPTDYLKGVARRERSFSGIFSGMRRAPFFDGRHQREGAASRAPTAPEAKVRWNLHDGAAPQFEDHSVEGSGFLRRA